MKKRFKIESIDMHLRDTETGDIYNCYHSEDICHLLNEQDKEIERYKYALKGLIRNCGNASCELRNNKAIEVLEKLKEFCEENCDELIDRELDDYHVKVISLDKTSPCCDVPLYEYIDTQIAELRGKKNEQI